MMGREVDFILDSLYSTYTLFYLYLLQMAFSAVAAQLVAVIFNGTVYPLLILMLVASVLSLVCFRLGVGTGKSV
ncbi:MAG: hypothetical protein COA96_15205 [SAR86 cluster bacterium]|uniref:Uncharacterized protein n=1 Tax=SAR86 cluster bacterium TaxID=2030880 RepID=A0A2A5ARG2_9GAMM|nr:MAG: hypothetical protein COA96_15205 [SAR86 cluster bacterium]